MRAERTLIYLTWALFLVPLAACGLPREAPAPPATSTVTTVPTEAAAVPITETPLADRPDLTAIDPFLIPLLHALPQTPPYYDALQASMSSVFFFSTGSGR